MTVRRPSESLKVMPVSPPKMAEPTWPADDVVRRPVSELKPYAKNSRVHSDAQIDQIVRSIQEWGWTMPILLDEDSGIIAGHARVLAAAKLELHDVPSMVARGWSEAQKKAYVIADNKLAENAAWEPEILRAEFDALKAMSFDLSFTGFSPDEIGALQPRVGKTDPDEVPETPETPTTRVGDVWVLGSHRILCGDSTKADDVAKALRGAKPHLMVTDPPYGVNYDPDWRNRAARTSPGMGNRFIGAGAVGLVENDDRDDWRAAWDLFPGDVAYVWHSAVHSVEVAESLQVAKFVPRAQIIWAKQQMVIGRGDYHWQHEPCWYAVRKSKKGHWAGDRKQTTLWQIDKPVKSETGHSTQKPVECMKRPIENNSKAGDAVYEPFSGSGTTIIAGEMTGRKVYAIEVLPAYVDVAVERWQNFTGKEATLEATGQTFEQAKKERSAGSDMFDMKTSSAALPKDGSLPPISAQPTATGAS